MKLLEVVKRKVVEDRERIRGDNLVRGWEMERNWEFIWRVNRKLQQ